MGVVAALVVGALILVFVNWPPRAGAQRAWLNSGTGTAQVRAWLGVFAAAALLTLVGTIASRWVPALLGIATGAAGYSAQAAAVILVGRLYEKKTPAALWVVTLLVATAMLAVIWLALRPERPAQRRPPPIPAALAVLGVVVVAGSAFVRGIPSPYGQRYALYVLVGAERLDPRDLVLPARPLVFLAVAALLLLDVGGRSLRAHHLAAAAARAGLGALDVLGATYMDAAPTPRFHNSGTLIAVTLTGLATYSAGILAAWRHHDHR